MLSPTVVFAIAAIIALYYYYVKRDKRLSKFPPGPWGLPIIGSAIEFGRENHPADAFSKWAKKYGPTVGVKIGPERFVSLHDVKMIRELFNEPVFTGKPQNDFFRILSSGNYGVLNSEGPTWEAQRRFTLRHLRDFGFGKNTMELLIMEEVREILDWMKNEEGHPVSVCKKFSLAVVNSLWMIVSGTRFDQNDATLNDLLENLLEAMKGVAKNPIILFAPWMCKLAPRLIGVDKLIVAVDNINTFVKKTLDDHEITENQPRDFMEDYMQEVKKTTDPKSSFYKEEGVKNMLAIISDLFQAGSETTSITLTWAILYLMREPNVQKKLQEEIDNVIGKSRVPSLADRPSMPYTEAVLMEVLRFSSLVPGGAIHVALQDKEFNGYFFPKGTWIFPNLSAIHHSQEIWGDPENFRPERFIGESGKLMSKPDAFMPFQVGKRQCVGETLARDTLFLFTTSIFQRFVIHPDPANPKPTIKPQIGFINIPEPYTVIMKERLEI